MPAFCYPPPHETQDLLDFNTFFPLKAINPSAPDPQVGYLKMVRTWTYLKGHLHSLIMFQVIVLI